ncbi:MAG TPA: glycosyltransferase [Candidatus Angelobacter sp.]
MLVTIAGILSVLAWLYLLLGRGGFWRVSRHFPALLPKSKSPSRIAVIIPARNEAGVIGKSISSLINQTGDHAIHIFLVDDDSSDGTAERARLAANQASKSLSLTIIEGATLPAGWTGKLWAVQQGIAQAREWQPDFFLLTDADILHASNNIATLVSIAENSSYDLASFMVKLQCQTAAEKLLIPAFVFFFFELYPPAWISNSGNRTAGAAGGSILVRPEALENAGGIEAIQNEIIDDCALARIVKQNGSKVWLGMSAKTVSLRPYKTFTEMDRMISRTAFSQLNHSTLRLLLALVGMALIYAAPPFLLFTRQWFAFQLGLSAWLLMTCCYLPMVRFYFLNPLWALTLPLAAVFYMAATFHSAIKYWSGRGGEWKGRSQDRG